MTSLELSCEPPPELRLRPDVAVEIETKPCTVSAAKLHGAQGHLASLLIKFEPTIVFQFEFRCLGGHLRQRPVGLRPTYSR